MTATGNTERARAIVDVHLLLVDRAERLLLGERLNTGFADGCWHLPAGHVEEGEPLNVALVREAHEELGIQIAPEWPELVHVMHQPGRVATFFLVRRWRGRLQNMEPHKCRDLKWFRPDDLPEQMVTYCREALEAIGHGEAFSLSGWEPPVDQNRAA